MKTHVSVSCFPLRAVVQLQFSPIKQKRQGTYQLMGGFLFFFLLMGRAAFCGLIRATTQRNFRGSFSNNIFNESGGAGFYGKRCNHTF